jgi:hypothetical protein
MPAKINPVFKPAVARSFLVKSISTFTLSSADVSASTAPGGAIDMIIKTVSERATIVAHSAFTTGATFWLEGEFPTDTYDGVNAETFAKHLQDSIQALGTVNAINLSTATVAAGPVFKADQI